MKTARLENWVLGHCDADGPGTLALFGEVHGHTDFPNGRAVVTSVIKEIDLIKQEATTQNTLYTLVNRSSATFDRYRAINHKIASYFHPLAEVRDDGSDES